MLNGKAQVTTIEPDIPCACQARLADSPQALLEQSERDLEDALQALEACFEKLGYSDSDIEQLLSADLHECWENYEAANAGAGG
jgi:hypothetical protein